MYDQSLVANLGRTAKEQDCTLGEIDLDEEEIVDPLSVKDWEASREELRVTRGMPA